MYQEENITWYICYDVRVQIFIFNEKLQFLTDKLLMGTTPESSVDLKYWNVSTY